MSSFSTWSRAVVLACVLAGAAGMSMAQTVEDHSLPGSAIKTFHVKCASGRLGMIRYDTRREPARVCASVQDGSRPQSCVSVPQKQVTEQVKAAGAGLCQ